MPFTAIVWNVEDLGTRFSGTTTPGLYDELRLSLIAALVKKRNAQVLVLQEMRRQAIGDHAKLLTELAAGGGGTWHYDWLPGSLVRPSATPTFSDLGYHSRGNSEGYAVFWAEGSLAPIDDGLSAGMDVSDLNGSAPSTQRYISLVFEGLELEINSESSPVIQFGTAVAQLGFPQASAPQVGVVHHTRSGTSDPPEQLVPQWLDTRRPCFVQLQLGAQRVVPLVVYHAPAGGRGTRSSYYGTLIGLAAAGLQQTECIFSGDFNITDPDQQAELFDYVTSQLVPPFNTTTYINNRRSAPMRSMVHYSSGTPRKFRLGLEIFGSPRDYAFARTPPGSTAPTLEIYDVVSEEIVAADGSLRQALLELGADFQQSLIDGVGAATSPASTDLLKAYFAGPLDPHAAESLTTGAVLYNELLSDHLPVIITYP